MKRKSYFTNFSTDSLFVVLEQNYMEYQKLEQKQANNSNPLLKERMKQVELVMAASKSIITERYLEDNVSLNEIAGLLIKSKGIRESVYKNLFTLKLLETNEIISLNLLTNAVNRLDISELMLIIRNKPNTVYSDIALKIYDEMIFDVEPEVYQEYVLKKRLDGRM